MERRRYRVRRFTLIKNFSIPARMYTAGGLAMAGLLATAMSGYFGLMQSNDGLAASITATSAVLNQKHADMMHDALRGDVLYALQIGPEGSADLRRGIVEDLGNHVADFKNSINALDALALSPDLRGKVDDVGPKLTAYIQSAQRIVSLALRDHAAATAQWDPFMAAFSELETTMEALGTSIEAEGNAVASAARARNLVLLEILLGAAVTAALVLVVSNLVMARSITRPIKRVKEAIEQIVKGNLGGRYSSFDRASDLNDEVAEIAVHLETLRVRLREAVSMEAEIKRTQADQTSVVSALSVGLEDLSQGRLTDTLDNPFSPEYEPLRQNFNKTIERLNQTLSQVAKASRSIRGQADDISNASEDLSRRTENQAATLEQTAAALDQLTASVKEAASGAREVEGIVQNTRAEVEDSSKIVVQAVEAMSGIERSSEQISRIIGVIEDIAFQTNLLALNAGVEAARAGDSGRGFAVVASEVRALAQRSSDASREIKELITTSTELVGRGVRAVGSAGKALGTIVDRVGHISTLVSGIAEGAASQSSALGEVNIGVNQLDQVAQRNASMVEQSMSATQALQQEALGLDEIMSRFTTTGSAAPGRHPVPLRRAG